VGAALKGKKPSAVMSIALSVLKSSKTLPRSIVQHYCDVCVTKGKSRKTVARLGFSPRSGSTDDLKSEPRPQRGNELGERAKKTTWVPNKSKPPYTPPVTDG